LQLPVATTTETNTNKQLPAAANDNQPKAAGNHLTRYRCATTSMETDLA
jgi:hypothetical protein